MAESERKSRRTVSGIAMMGIVAGFVIVFGWFITPGLDRNWLVLGGFVLAVSGIVGLISTRRPRPKI